MVLQGLEWTFNEVAAAYDRWSPGYTPALYRDMFAYKAIGPSSRVVEIGIGTGQASVPVLETGCALTAVEYGDKLAAFTREKFRGYQNLTIVNLPFQNFECGDGSADWIYAAGAFHWIPEELGYAKVFRLLKPGGAFARFAKHPYYREGQEALYQAIQEVYREYMPYSAPTAEYGEEDAKRRAALPVKYGFTDTAYKLYDRKRVTTSQEYIGLIATQSDHIVLAEDKRQGFYGGIKDAIDRYGGMITLHDTIDLELARKPG